MGEPERELVVVRHGATEWSETGRHTSRTDLPLLPKGREDAAGLAECLDSGDFARVLCSPLRRARETCELAGFADRAEIDEDLREWEYGEYEGLTTPQIREERPDWWLWRDGCPGGESPDEVGERASRLLDGLGPGRTIAFAHGHILRVVSSLWIELGVEGGSRLALHAGRIGVLAHERDVRVLDGWNVRSL
jgi:broad specificity phosphatase PhoE